LIGISQAVVAATELGNGIVRIHAQFDEQARRNRPGSAQPAATMN
jgi:hypothetical protein